MTETEKIVKRIEEAAGPGEEEILAAEIRDWLRGETRREMLLGQRYYENRGDIQNRVHWIVGADGQLKADRLPAARIAHGFVRKLVDQKAQYLFGKPFTIRASDPAFAEKLQQLFDPVLRNTMRGLCKEAVNKGIAWLQVWPEAGSVRFRRIPSEELLPIWEDGRRERLQKMLQIFPMEIYEKDGKKRKLRVRCWDEKGVQDYWYAGGKLTPDGERMPHLLLDGEGMLLERLPFIPFRYNEEELPLIRFIKPLVDDYDRLKSQDSDDLGETSGAVMVLQNYDGTDLGEFRENLAKYRAVKVSDGGGLEIKSQPVHTESLLAHLRQDRRDLYEIGRGVDTQTDTLGNASGVTMKFLYADLDLDCAGIESSFSAGFQEMADTAALFYQLMGEGDYSGAKAEIVLNRDIIINEGDAIEECVQSAGLISRRTVLENHPWVVDAEEEERRLEAAGAEAKKEDGE